MTYEDLHVSWCVFRAGKKPSQAIDTFAYNLGQNLEQLAAEVSDRTYSHGSYTRVTITEKKRRDLAVAAVRDRVVHRYLYDRLVKLFDPSFDPDVWSCRKGKGLHKALDRSQRLLARYSQSYVWRADITKFFDHVDQGVLLTALGRKLPVDTELYWLCEQVITSYNTQPASPIL